MTETWTGESFIELGQHYQQALADAREAEAAAKKSGAKSQATDAARIASQLRIEIVNALSDSAKASTATFDNLLQVLNFDGMRKSGTSDDDAKATLRAALRPQPFNPDDDPIACASWDPKQGWPDREWLIEGWLPVGRLGMLSGRGGRGKSRLALQLSARLAGKLQGPVLRGSAPALHIDRAHGPVVYVSWEDERDEIGRRLKSMAIDGLVDIKCQENRLLFLDLRREGPLWAPGAGQHMQTLAALTDVGGRVRATAESLQARLLVLDSLAGAYASDENVRPLVRAFCADWDAWGTDHNCAVLLIAHPPKRSGGQRSSTDDSDSDDDFSGSTDWHNAVRWRWSLGPVDTRAGHIASAGASKKPVRALALRCVKSSYGPVPNQPVFLTPTDRRIGWQAQTAAVAARMAAQLGGFRIAHEETHGQTPEDEPTIPTE